MRKLKKLISIIAILAFASNYLTGCGNSTKAVTEEVIAASVETTTSVENIEEKEETVTTVSNNDEKAVVKEDVSTNEKEDISENEKDIIEESDTEDIKSVEINNEKFSDKKDTSKNTTSVDTTKKTADTKTDTKVDTKTNKDKKTTTSTDTNNTGTTGNTGNTGNTGTTVTPAPSGCPHTNTFTREDHDVFNTSTCCTYNSYTNTYCKDCGELINSIPHTEKHHATYNDSLYVPAGHGDGSTGYEKAWQTCKCGEIYNLLSERTFQNTHGWYSSTTDDDIGIYTYEYCPCGATRNKTYIEYYTPIPTPDPEPISDPEPDPTPDPEPIPESTPEGEPTE